MKVSVHELRKRLENGETIRLVDVRTRPEFDMERPDVDCLDHHALSEIDSIEINEDETLYLICQTGMRSARAQQHLLDRGHEGVINVEGGLNAWKTAKLPVTRSQRAPLPLMRQVQLTAGMLILLGTLGSLYLSPAWIWLAVFVGAGLTQAGITGFCGLARLLLLMPWNRSRDEAAAAQQP